VPLAVAIVQPDHLLTAAAMVLRGAVRAGLALCPRPVVVGAAEVAQAARTPTTPTIGTSLFGE